MKIDRGTLRGFGGVLTALLIIGAIHQFRPSISSAPDFPCTTTAGPAVAIDVSSGETGSEIALDLANAGVIKSSQSFFRLAVADARAERIAPGTHRIDTGICAKKALEQLLDSSRISNLLVIQEGAWISEIKRSLIDIGFSQSEINQGFASLAIPHGYRSLEGLLFPAQYSFDTSTPFSTILKSVVDRGLREVEKAGLSKGDGKFTVEDLLTIASLVQAEGDEKDFAKISQVVRNRVSKGMPLQFDSTIHYIKGSRGSVFLSTQSTYLKSPFNTYRNYGLPPTPINNPGSAAMKAALNPENGPWIFFITVAPGDTRFTDSIEQFNEWKVLYKKNLKAGAFRSSQ